LRGGKRNEDSGDHERHVVSIGMNEPVRAAAKLLRQYNVWALPGLRQQKRLRGILTDRDIVTAAWRSGRTR
jgi:CBS-domain-containing membrane protein